MLSSNPITERQFSPDPDINESMMINGTLVERYGPREFVICDPDPKCPRDKWGHGTFKGRSIVNRIPLQDPAASVRERLSREFPVERLVSLDRGVLREDVEEVAGGLEDEATATMRLQGDALKGVLAGHDGPRVPWSAFEASPWASICLAAIEHLRADAYAAPDASFQLGRVSLGLDRNAFNASLLTRPAIDAFIDEHSRTPGGGVYGSVASISPEAAFCAAFASPAELNLQSLAARSGPVVSRTHVPRGTHQLPVAVEIVTYLSQDFAETFVFIGAVLHVPGANSAYPS